MAARTETTDLLSGPIRIAEVSGAMEKIGLGALLNLAAVMSISVGLLNLFSIPLLDGGHLFYYAVKLIRGNVLRLTRQRWLRSLIASSAKARGLTGKRSAN